MKYISIASFLFLLGLTFFGWGFSAGLYNIFPHSTIAPFLIELKQFSEGHELEKKTSVIEKLQNDFAVVPRRELVEAKLMENISLENVYDKTSLIDQEYSQPLIYLDRVKFKDSNIAGLVISTKLKLKNDSETGGKIYYVILDIDGKVRKIIDRTGNQKGVCDSTSEYKFHTIEKQGSVIRTKFIQLNSCGEREWEVKGNAFHHHYRQDSQTETSVWVWDGVDMVEYSKDNGAEIQRISIGEVINANPLLHIFEPRLKMNLKQKWVYGDAEFKIADEKSTYVNVTNADHDPFHPNDIDPLTKAYADQYDMFERGDLLMSFRSINLVCVLRPETKKIIWYTNGLTSRQHDPDWNIRGSISIFDNNFHNDFSVISEIQPTTSKIDYLIGNDGQFSFYKATGGSHEISEDGRLVFLGTDSFLYGKEPGAQNISFMFANQFNDGLFLESSIEDILDQETMNEICLSNYQ